MFGRVFRAFNALILGQVISRLSSFVLLPLFLAYWTPTVYGEYLALFAVVSYLATLDIGVQLAAVNLLTKYYAREEFAEYRRCHHSALALYTAVALVLTVAAVAAAALLPIPTWIGLRQTPRSVATWTIIFLALYTLWAMPARVISSMYQTTGNLARSQWVVNIQQVLASATTVVMLITGGNMAEIAFLQLATLVLTTAYVWWDVLRRYPQLRPSLAGANLASIRELLHPSLMFALLMIANLLAFQGNLLIVSAVLGGAAVAIFSVTRTLVTAVREVLYSANVSLWPDLARMESLQQFGKLRVVHRISLAVAAGLACGAASFVWFEGASVITFWTRGRLVPDLTLLHVFALYTALQTPFMASASVSTATNRHSRFAITFMVAAVLSVGFTRLFIHHLGVTAAALGLLLGEALGCYHFVIQDTCRIIGEPYARFALRFWAGWIAVAGASWLLADWAHSQLPMSLVVRWIVVAGAAFAPALALAPLLWLEPDDRAKLWSRFRARFRNKEIVVAASAAE